MGDNVIITLNLSTGEVNIEAPADSLGTIFENLESFLPKLSASHIHHTPEQLSSEPQEQSAIEQKSPFEASVTLPNKQSPKRKKTSQSKKPESYSIVDLGLEPAQRESLFVLFIKIRSQKRRMNNCWLLWRGLKITQESQLLPRTKYILA